MSPMSNLRYRAVDPDVAEDAAELVKQRRVCGWGYDNIAKYMKGIEAGAMQYFIFFIDGTDGSPVIIGSGGMDLNGVHEDEMMCSHESSTFCAMGMFLYPEFRGRGYFKRIAEIIIDRGYRDLELQYATVMTAASNQITNRYFTNLGFKEFFREPKPDWNEENAVGIHYKQTRKQWLELTRN